MKIKYDLMLFLLILGCSNPNESADNLDVGQALITIENSQFDANAVMDYKVLIDTEFENISLIINDSVRMEILKETFIEEQVIWTIEDNVSQDLLFSLQYNYFGGSPYMPLEGYLTIDQRTESIISGEFEITLTGGASSCITCPEALKNVNGKFIVKTE